MELGCPEKVEVQVEGVVQQEGTCPGGMGSCRGKGLVGRLLGQPLAGTAPVRRFRELVVVRVLPPAVSERQRLGVVSREQHWGSVERVFTS